MKKTQIIELFKDIQKSWITFTSVIVFVMLGVTIFLGLSWSSKAITSQITNDNIAQNNSTLDIYFPYAVSSKQVNSLKDISGVDEVEGSYEAYAKTKINKKSFSSKFISLTDHINQVELVSGKMPENDNEVVIEETCKDKYDLKVGDTVTVTKSDATSSALILQLNTNTLNKDSLNKKYSYVKKKTFKITGVVSSSEVYSIDSYGTNYEDGSNIRMIFYCKESAYDENAVSGYNHILIVNKDLQKYDYNSSEYKATLANLTNQLKPYIKRLSSTTYKTIKTNYNTFITESQKQLDSAKVQIDNGRSEIEAAKKKVEKGKATLAKAKEELKAGKEAYKNAQKIVDEVQPKIDELEKLLTKYGFTLNDLSRIDEIINEKNQQFNNDLNELGLTNDQFEKIASYYTTYKDELDTITSSIDTLESEMHSSDIEYNDEEFHKIKDIYQSYKAKFDEIIQIHEMYHDALKQYGSLSNIIDLYKQYVNLLEQMKDGAQKIAEAEALISQYEKQIAEAEAKIKAAEDKLESAINEYTESLSLFNQVKDKESQIKDYDVVTMSVLTNTGYIIIQNVLSQLENLKLGLGGLFFVIAMMICYNALSRLIKDHRKAIGTKKALGFIRREITLFYLSYTTMMAVIGVVSGTILAVVVENILSKHMLDFFSFTITKLYISYKDIGMIFILELSLFILVTIIAIVGTLRKTTIVLLKDEPMSKGKSHFYDHFPIFKRQSLLFKTIVNNCFEDSKRVLSTIVSITSCVVLLITPLTLRNNVLDAFNAQFKDIYHFDTTMQVKDSNNYAKEDIDALLEEKEIPYISVYHTQGYIDNGETSCFVGIWVYDDADALSKIVSFKTQNGKTPVKNNGIYLPDSLVMSNSATINDTFNIQTLSNENADTTITDYYLSYSVSNDVFMDKETYESIFHADYRKNYYLLDTTNVNQTQLKKELLKQSGVISIDDFKVEQKEASSIFASIANVVVIVYFVVSILLGVFVLTNLLDMLVEEKKREMIILMINGYTLKQAKQYVSLDTKFLTVISIILGVLIGNITGNTAVTLMESKYIRFIHAINLPANFISIGIMIVLIFVISHIVFRKINHFRLTDINKD